MLGAQSTMKAFGRHAGISAVSDACNNFIHEVRSFLAKHDVKMKAMEIPLCHLSNTMKVYTGNYRRARNREPTLTKSAKSKAFGRNGEGRALHRTLEVSNLFLVCAKHCIQRHPSFMLVFEHHLSLPFVLKSDGEWHVQAIELTIL